MMRQSAIKTVSVTALAFGLIGLSGCSVYPGTNLDENLQRSVMYDDDNGSVPGGPYATQLVRITPDVVSRQRKQAALRDDFQKLQTLLDSEEQGAYIYRVGIGDILGVNVFGHPELSTSFDTTSEEGRVVNARGEIYFPFVGTVNVANKSLGEIRKVLARGISNYIENPQVDVSVVEYRSQKVYLTGDSDASGISVPITDVPLRVIDALNLGGRTFGRNSDLQLRGPAQRNRSSGRVILTRDGERYSIDILSYLREGKKPPNVLLKDNDILYIEPNINDKIFVIGETNQNGVLLMEEGRMTLAEGLLKANGINQNTADASEIFVIRGLTRYNENNVPYRSAVVYSLDMTTADSMILADQFRLQPRDAIFVSATGLAELNRVIGQILPSLRFVTTTESTRLILRR